MEQHAQRLLTQFRHLKPTEPEAGASTPEQHPEPPKEPAKAPTVGPAEASVPDLFELGMTVGAECLARIKMPTAESKSMHVVVTPLIHCANLEEPPAPLTTL
ncbi:hypothetical protein VULLAG_LOCUS4395 [Vulpes lagopus]